jgi:hypothetical protein
MSQAAVRILLDRTSLTLGATRYRRVIGNVTTDERLIRALVRREHRIALPARNGEGHPQQIVG